MAQLKKILISLPDNLLKEVDSIVAMEKINRSEFVREAMKLYIREKRRIEMRDKLKKAISKWLKLILNLQKSVLKQIMINSKNMRKVSGSWKRVVIKRGDIFYADLSPVIGSEQGGIRPVLIVQNDIGNKYSPTVIASAITSQINKAKLPTHIELSAKEYGLPKDSVVLLEQIRTIDKKRLREKIGHLDDELMEKVNEALSISFGLIDM